MDTVAGEELLRLKAFTGISGTSGSAPTARTCSRRAANKSAFGARLPPTKRNPSSARILRGSEGSTLHESRPTSDPEAQEPTGERPRLQVTPATANVADLKLILSKSLRPTHPMKMHGPCHPCPIGGKTLWLVLSLISSLAALPQSPPQLRVERGVKGLELSWPAGKPDATGSGVALFELQQSTDLQHWSPLGERQRAPANVPTATLNAVALPSETNQYFRLLSLDPAVGARLAQGGAEVFGYADAFNEALQVVGQISPDQFASQFPHAATYLEGISWDPTTAQCSGLVQRRSGRSKPKQGTGPTGLPQS